MSYGFYGTYRYTLDDKGRLTMPAPLRDPVPAGPDGTKQYFLARWRQGCIAAFGGAGWEKVVEQLEGLGLPERDKLARAFFAGVYPVSPDAQGRVLVPEELRIHAGIQAKGEVVVVGVHNRIEIWEPARWSLYQATDLASYDEPADQLSKV